MCENKKTNRLIENICKDGNNYQTNKKHSCSWKRFFKEFSMYLIFNFRLYYSFQFYHNFMYRTISGRILKLSCFEKFREKKKLNSYTRSTIGRDKVTDENFCIFFYTLHPSRSHTTGLALGSQFKQSSTWFYTRSGCVHSNITYCIIKVLKPETFSNVSNHTNPELKC